MLLENTIFVGLVVPGETVLLAAGVLAGRGLLNIYLVIAIAFFATATGNIIGYFIGFHGGRPLINKYGKKFHLSKRVSQTEKFFEKHGVKSVFIGRFVTGVRVFIASFAGIGRMNFGLFVVYSILSAAIWTVLIALLGFFFGQNYQILVSFINKFGLVLLITLIVILVIYFIRAKNAKIQNFRKDKKKR